MSWAVGWDRELRRFRGYGVPAYCDAKGCRAEIDRGLAYVREPYGLEDDEEFDDLADGAFFTCSDHGHADVDEWDLPPEHPTWVAHVMADDSWAQWRSEHPDWPPAALRPSP